MVCIHIKGDREGMPKIKVTYFFARGRAELCRLLLIAGGIAFEDERVEHEVFSKWKAEGSLPFGQLPILTVDGRVFGQSYSCAKFCAKLSGFIPIEPLAALEIEGIIDATDDIRCKYVPIRYLPIEKDETVGKYRSFFGTILPLALANLNRLLGDNDYFCASTTLTAADIAVTNLFHQLQLPNCPLHAGDPDVVAMSKVCIDAFPSLVALQARVEADPKIELHLSHRTTVEHGLTQIALEDREGTVLEVKKA